MPMPAVARAGCRAEFAVRGMHGWAAAKAARNSTHNAYTTALWCTKALHWKTWLEDITEADIWCASRYATASLHDGSTLAIPPLRAPSLTDPTIT